MAAQRDSFSGKIGFILSAVGFAIGMGTFWRFPYLCGQNGGAIFLLLYIVAMAFIALPLFALEISMGSLSKKDAVGAYKFLAPGRPWFINGYANVLAMFLIISSTIPIGSWVIVYFTRAISGALEGLTPEQVATYYDTNIVNNPVEVNAWVIGIVVLMTQILKHRLDKGLELANRICIPLLFVMLLILAGRAITLPGAAMGIEFVFTPDFSKLTGEVVLKAVGQAFYAVGVAMAVSIVFGSYMKKKDKQVVKNAMAVGIGIISAAILAGIMIFPCVFAFGQIPDAGPQLIFITMPNIFDQMPMGRLFSIMFYLLFFLAAFSTWLAGFEAMIATMRDQFGYSRNKAVIVGAVLIAVLGVISANKSEVLLITDNIVGYLLTLCALCVAIFGGWFWKLHTFYEEANIKSPLAQNIMSALIKFIIPIVVIVLLLQVIGWVH